MGCQSAGLLLAGVHDGQLCAGIEHGIATGVVGAVDALTVQVDTNLGILHLGRLRLQLDVVHQLVVTGGDRHLIGLRPLVPGDGFLTVLTFSLVSEHVVGTLIQEHMGHVACQVGNGIHAVHLHGISSNAHLAGQAGHIVDAGIFVGLQKDLHTVHALRGVQLDQRLCSRLHIELPAKLLQRHIVKVENIHDNAVFIKLKTHQVFDVDGVDQLSVRNLQRDFLAVQNETNVEITVAFRHTGRQAGFRLAVVFRSVYVPIQLIGRNLRTGGCIGVSSRCRGTAGALR